jgi:hypothetical protein
MTWDFRHHCRESDAIADDGVAAVLYDRWNPGWFLVHSDGASWELWDEDRSLPFPLRFLTKDPYPQSILIEYCPWCATPLAEDVDLLAWLQDQTSRKEP